MNLQTALEMGLNKAEYAQIIDLLQREPTLTELGMFAVMWSEHCGYKYSRPILSLFKNYREAQEQGALENAGVIALDDDLGIVFKVESHNHPSAVEPFQGAATGVGGILRDIFTMGARPVASLNSLRFGPLSNPHNRYLFEHVVAGISHYGNCVGVPTVAGEVMFHASYSGNPLVNAMAVGVVERSRIAGAAATGIGNPVLYVGSATGRDGIHGATFASVELGPDSESRRPNVQMGDPFMEKLLIEATLEALASGYIVGIQDMGAAGLTCSTCETASKGGTGMEIDVRKVPLREADMTPYEIMLSESQERMLCIVQDGKEEAVQAIFKKWGLHAAFVGRVTDDGLVRIRDNGEIVAEVPARALTDMCPTYHLDTREPEEIKTLQGFDPLQLPEPHQLSEPLTYSQCLLRLLDSPTIASKQWVTDQYDSMVQTQTLFLPGADAAVLRIRGSEKAIAVKIDGNGRYCRLDPFAGGQAAVAEACRNIACTGARPAGLTDNLNFANPEKPAGFWQFQRAVQGIAQAAEAFEVPVVSGNVSFYNETPEGPILPTPTIGAVGILDRIEHARGAAFTDAGCPVLLLQAYSDPSGGLGGSEFLSLIHGKEAGKPPLLSLEGERNLQQLLLAAAKNNLSATCHDLSEGGLAVALAECCILSGIGAYILLTQAMAETLPLSALLFGEAQGRALVTVNDEKDIARLEKLAQSFNVHAHWIGTTGGQELRIAVATTDCIRLPLGDMSEAWESAIPRRMSLSTAS